MISNSRVQKHDSIPKELLIPFFAMTLGMFMAILDIQIVASSLFTIGAGLSASVDELSWIQTSYLIAEVVAIIVSGFLARVLSTRIAYCIASTGFTITSILCASASNIELMIFFRVLQGLFGGVMIPLAFSTIFTIFPKNLHNKVTMIMGLVITVAPTIGPTLGGYITELFSWQLMFIINIIPGIFVSVAIFRTLHIDQADYSLMKKFDFLGFVLIALSLGILQYILEEGSKKNWFSDIHILVLSIISFVSFILLIIREVTYENPIVRLTAFKNRNFSLGCLYSFTVGIGLYGAVYVIPLFLFRIAGFNTLQIGATMMISGIAQFISAPIVANIMNRVEDKRYILATGYLLFGFGCYLNSFLGVNSSFEHFVIPQIVRGFSLMFCFMPLNNFVFSSMNPTEMKDASSLYNLTRNLGGAIGLALINTVVTSKNAIFASHFKGRINESFMQNFIDFLRVNGLPLSTENSIFVLNWLIDREAFILAINNIFIMLSFLFALNLLLLFTSENIKQSNV